MTPMLRLVAREYARRHTPDELASICFVFPNKRSATFFLRYLDLEMRRPHIEPEVMTIADFTASLSPLAEAPRFMQLATLYEAYRAISPESAPDFDRFLFWGETLLSDFADVDRYLANTRELFSNIEELREINSTYLTAEQREIIRQYWGDGAPGLDFEPRGESDEAERFWTHIKRPGDTASSTDKFVSLWRVLSPLYERFNAMLEADGYATSGRHYRDAARMLTELGGDAPGLGASRYVFVGFNFLSSAEVAIFKALQKAGRADFYWDVRSRAFAVEGNKAGAMALRGAALFPSLYEIEEPEAPFPRIEVIGVASGVSQGKVAAGRLSEWHREGLIGASADDASGTDTAVVLADEAMLMPMLSYLPDETGTTNVTMGFPMKLTPVAAVMRSAIALQRRMRLVAGRPAFFYEDVVALLSQPVVRSIAPAETDAMLREISERRMFTVDAAKAAEDNPLLAPLFTPLGPSGEASLEESEAYISSLIELFSHYATEEERPVERRFLMAYRAALDELTDAFRRRGIAMRESTMASMLERALATATVSFVGEPLRGVQIMGILETRSLDFDNIIMMSMNETVYPRRHSRPSFIPEALRHAFGLPGKDLAESVYGYYFFRLLSRASRVTLLYDARTVGIEKVGEMSRYISQLIYLFPEAKVSHRSAVFPELAGTRKGVLSIAKTPAVMEKLKRFTQPDSGRNFSASSLNTYINCPMQFYLEAVEGLNFATETDGADFIDYSTFGTIVHEVAQKLYEEMAARRADRMIHPETLRAVADNRTAIMRLVTAAVNRNYLHLCGRDEPDRFDPLRGESMVLAGIVVELMQCMLRREAAAQRPFRFEKAEFPLTGQVTVSDKLPPVNIRQVIDRIDYAGHGDTLRFVDYKTGGDKLDFSSVEAAFDGTAQNRPKVLFQLMFYCFCYRGITGYDGPIQPFVYLVRSMFTERLRPVTVGKEPLVDYRDKLQEFETHLARLIEEIFDPEKPFEARVNDPDYDGHNCNFCRFKDICNPPER